MREPLVNPRFLFPATGWRCFSCTVYKEPASSDFAEVPVIGWGVVEGYDYEEGNELEGSNMDLLVAVQDELLEAPMVKPASQLDDDCSNRKYGFLPDNGELTNELKKMLEENTRRRVKQEEEWRKEKVERTRAFVLKRMDQTTSIKCIADMTKRCCEKERIFECSEELVKKIITVAGFLLPQEVVSNV
jgi:hypothetical protein